MSMDRRTALELLGLGVVGSSLEAAQEHVHALRNNPQDYKLQFFSTPEERIIGRVAEMIIPADEHSPGAHEARVSYYIDLVAANSSESVKANWKSRLAAFDRMAMKKHGKAFPDLSAEQQAALLNAVSAKEAHPQEPAEQFFVDMKKATLFGYYSSQIGVLKELEYKGNTALSAFPGCTHARHT